MGHRRGANAPVWAAQAAIIVLTAVLAGLLPATAASAAEERAGAKAAGTVVGTVKAPSGDGLSGVLVQAFWHGAPQHAANAVATATTGAGGTYGLDLLPGAYAIVAVPPKDSPDNLARASARADVAEGASPLTRDFQLSAANVFGVVRDSTGATVADTAVEVERGDGFTAATRTYDDGTYRLALPQAGGYRLTAMPPAGNPLLDAPAYTEVVIDPAGETHTDVDIALRKPNVRGSVLSPDGSVAIDGASVTILSGGYPVAGGTTLTRADGAFGVVLAPGTYSVQAHNRHGNPELWAHADTAITVTDAHTGDTPHTGAYRLREPLIKGVVRQPNGTPVPHAPVHSFHDWYYDLRFGNADERGRYMVDQRPGQISVFTYAPYDQVDFVDLTETHVTTDPIVHDIVLPATNLKGRVTAPDGSEAPGAAAAPYPALGQEVDYPPGRNLSDGRFGFRVPAGDYRLIGFPPDHNPHAWGKVQVPLSVTDPNTIVDNIVLTLAPTEIPPYALAKLAPHTIDGNVVIEPMGNPVLSRDGKAAAWAATVRIPGTGGGEWEGGETHATIVTWDAATGATTLLKGHDGAWLDGWIEHEPAISGNGRYVAFWTDSDNLVAGDADGNHDVFVLDRQTGGVTRIGMTEYEPGAVRWSPSFDDQVTISDDGGVVAFTTEYWGPEDRVNEVEAVWLTEDRTGIERREAIATGWAMRPVLSGDGRYLAWVEFDWDTKWTVRVRDLVHGFEDAPRQFFADGGDWNKYDVPSAAFDADGSTLAYITWHTVPDGEYFRQIGKVRAAERFAGTDEELQVFPEGLPQSEGVFDVELSGDGSSAVVLSASPYPEDGDRPQAWTFDRATGARELVSQNPEREMANRGVWGLAAADDLRSILLQHDSGNLGGDDDVADYDTRIHLATAAETAPPTWPPGSALTAGEDDIGSTVVRLHWTPAEDDTAVTAYRVYANGAPVASADGTAGSAFVTGLQPDTQYQFQVQAVDAAGNESPDGPVLDVRTRPADTGELQPLQAAAGPGGAVHLSWSPPTQQGVTGQLVRRYAGDTLVKETPVAADAGSFDEAGLPSASSFTYRVFAVTGGGLPAPLTHPAAVEIPALTLSVVDHSATLAKTGLAKLGGEVRILARGEAGRSMTATVTFQSWHSAEQAMLEAPAPRQALVALAEDPAAPGTYLGTFPIAEGTTEITGVSGRIEDGHGASLDKASTRAPLPVSGSLRVVVDAPEDSLPDHVLQVSSPTTKLGYSRNVTGGGTFALDGLVPTDDVGIALLDQLGRTAGQSRASVLSGRTVTASVRPHLPASLAVRLRDGSGAPLKQMDVEITAGDGTVWLGKAKTDDSGSVTFPSLWSDLDVKAEPLVPRGALLVKAVGSKVLDPGANQLDITLANVELTQVTGQVLSPLGKPGAGAEVVLSQVREGYAHRFTAKAGDDGRFTVAALPGEGAMSAAIGAARGYVDVDVPAGGLAQDIDMRSDGRYEVPIRLFVQYPGSEEIGPVPLDWRTSVHLGVRYRLNGEFYATAGVPQGPDGVPVLSVRGQPGDVLSMCIYGFEARLQDQCVERPLSELGTALEMRARPAVSVTGRLRTADGQRSPANLVGRLDRLEADGTRTRVDTRSANDGFQLRPGAPGDYVLEFQSGQWSALARFTVGTSDVDLGDLLVRRAATFGSAQNAVTAAQTEVAPGGTVDIRAAFVNGSTAVAKAATARISRPAAGVVLPGSITLNGVPVPSTEDGGAHVVQLGDLDPGEAGVLRYRLRANDDASGRIAGAVSIRFNDTAEEPLHPVDIRVAQLTLEAPGTVESQKVKLSGRAPAGGVVSLLADGVLIGEAVATPGGLWSAVVDLPAGYGPEPSWEVVARARVGETDFTASKTVRLDESRPVLTQVSMFQRDSEFKNGRRFTFDPRTGVARFPFVIVPSQTTVVELTFDSPERVTRADVLVGNTRSVAVRQPNGTWAATFSGFVSGPVYVEHDGVPSQFDYGQANPTEQQVRDHAPWYLSGFEVVEGDGSTGEGSAASAVGGTGTFTTTAPGMGDDDKITGTLTVSRELYTPTQADLDFERESGVSVYQLDVSRTPDGLRVEGLIPLSKLPGAQASSASSASSKSEKAGAKAAVGVARVGFQWAFTGTTSFDSALSAWGSDEKYKNLIKALDAAMECGTAGARQKYAAEAEHLATMAALADVTGAALQVGSLLLAPATFGLGTVGLGVLGWAFDKASSYAIADATQDLMSQIANDEECKDEEDEDEEDDDDEEDEDPKDRKRKTSDPVWIYDPSGFVYEGTTSNRLEGVTATLLTGPTADGPWTAWDAEWFGQLNPQATNAEGRYGWDVPEGWWKVAYAKEGYEPAFSAALKVLPPHFDVNVGMVAFGLPQVTGAELGASAAFVDVSFNRPMLASSLIDEGAATVSAGGTPLVGEWTAVSPEDGLAKVFRFTPAQAFPPGSELTVSVQPVVQDYGGRVLPAEAVRTVKVPGTQPPPGPGPRAGYRVVGADGAVFGFGGAGHHGAMDGTPLNSPVVGGASTPSGKGYWLVAADGGVFAFGDARYFGSMGGVRLNQPIVGMAPTAAGDGYWLVARDGGVFAFGAARFAGSMGGVRLNQPIVSMAAAPGGGYWMVASDGGVFAFGGARFQGSTGGIRLNSPVVGMAVSANGGYWLVGRDGGVFAFGGAPFGGSTASIRLAAPMVGMAAAPGGGYWMVGSDGGVFAFGGAPFHGSAGGRPLRAPVVALTA